jgi:hypothetical protein
VLALALLLPALPAAASETLLLLGVLREGKLDTKVTHAVHDRLVRAGETLAAAPQLTTAERQCLVPECLDSLAGREKAQLVLAARVQQSAGFAYIAASMYDVAHQRLLDVSAVCDKCLPEAVSLRVGDLFTRLLRDNRDRLRAEAAAPRRPVAAPAQSASAPSAATAPKVAGPGTLVASKGVTWPTPSALVPAAAEPLPPRAIAPTPSTAASPGEQVAPRAPATTPSATAPAAMAPERAQGSLTTSSRPPERPRPFSPRRKLIAGVLGGIGVATLITAFALNVTDGRATTMDCDQGAAVTKFCVLDNKVAYTLGYAATSALAVSIGMTLFWPEPKPRSSEVK